MIEGYLARLGIPAPTAPTLAWLQALHRAHLDVLPYDNLAIMLGRPDPVDPATTLARVAAGGNAGYCFHHNGLLGHVLSSVGYQVEQHEAKVLDSLDATPGPPDHLALVVTVAGQRWWAEVGYGDGFRDPVLLVDGEVEQGPFRYRLDRVRDDGWTFHHDESGSFAATLVGSAGWSQDGIAEAHRRLATPPGAFTRLLVVQRRDERGAERLRGVRHTRVGEGGFVRDLTAYADWRAALVGLGVSLDGVEEAELRALYDRMLELHAAYVRPDGASAP